MDAWQGQAKNPEKLAPAAEVARHLGWNDLVADTFPSERKFNIWYFHDHSKDRSVIGTDAAFARFARGLAFGRALHPPCVRV
jgi:hypothetical protein